MVPVLDLTRRCAVLALATAALGACTQPSAGAPTTTRTAAGAEPGFATRTGTRTGAASSSAGRPPAASTTVPVPANAQLARVRSVSDGDTLHLVGSGAGPLSGSDQRVRLLEINAPEIHGTVDCFGPEATSALASLTPVGSTVRVVADREAQDKYGRPLLYVWNSEGTFVNEALVRGGAAAVLFVRPNDRYLPVMRQAEQDARNRQAGQWSACH